MINRSSVILLAILLAAGLVYRVYVASLAYREIRWDVQSYGSIAKEMMRDPLFVDCCQKAAGYPMFLTAVYRLFGADNLTAVAGVQSILDLLSAFLLYAVARRMFPGSAAVFVLVLVLFHPFAVSYVGFQLPETVTMLLLVSMLWVLSHPRFAVHPGLWVWFGLLLGLLLWVRLSFFYIVFLLIAVVAFCIVRAGRRPAFAALAALGFLAASLHSIISYQAAFDRWSLVPPYTMGMPAALYMSFFMDRYPELISQYDGLNRHYYDINLEYNTTHYTRNAEFRAKYQALFAEKIRSDWSVLAGNTLRNIIWMWDVNHLFVYEDPWYPADRLPVRILNISSLLLGAAGLLRYAKRKGRGWILDPALLFTLLVCLSVTLLFAPITNETRYVIPLYPLVLLWAGYGLTEVVSNWRLTKTKRRL